jgi:hypothetical protein
VVETGTAVGRTRPNIAYVSHGRRLQAPHGGTAQRLARVQVCSRWDHFAKGGWYGARKILFKPSSSAPSKRVRLASLQARVHLPSLALFSALPYHTLGNPCRYSHPPNTKATSAPAGSSLIRYAMPGAASLLGDVSDGHVCCPNMARWVGPIGGPLSMSIAPSRANAVGIWSGTPVLSVEEQRRGFTGTFEIVATGRPGVVAEKRRPNFAPLGFLGYPIDPSRPTDPTQSTQPLRPAGPL